MTRCVVTASLLKADVRSRMSPPHPQSVARISEDLRLQESGAGIHGACLAAPAVLREIASSIWIFPRQHVSVFPLTHGPLGSFYAAGQSVSRRLTA